MVPSNTSAIPGFNYHLCSYCAGTPHRDPFLSTVDQNILPEVACNSQVKPSFRLQNTFRPLFFVDIHHQTHHQHQISTQTFIHIGWLPHRDPFLSIIHQSIVVELTYISQVKSSCRLRPPFCGHAFVDSNSLYVLLQRPIQPVPLLSLGIHHQIYQQHQVSAQNVIILRLNNPQGSIHFHCSPTIPSRPQISTEVYFQTSISCSIVTFCGYSPSKMPAGMDEHESGRRIVMAVDL